MASRKQKLALACAATLAALGAAEGLLRWGPAPQPPLRPRRFFIEVPKAGPVEYRSFPFVYGEATSDPRIPTELLPNVQIELHYDAGLAVEHPYMDFREGWFTLAVELNEAGLRGAMPLDPKPEGTQRIACIGDSFTFGDGVPLADCWTANLPTEIERGPVEVVNYGVPGYDSSDVLASLEAKVLPQDPDLVIWTVVLNDPPTTGDEELLAYGKRANAVLTESREPPTGLARFSRIAERLQTRSRQAQLQPAYFDFIRAHFRPNGLSWKQFEVDLGAMAKLTESHSTPFLVVIFPMLNGLDTSYPFTEQHAQIAQACKQLNLPYLDLAPAFAGHRPQDMWVHPADQHPNPKAHAIAWNAINRYLTESDTLPPFPGR